ncbi:MAG TPA: hypothetical protein VNW29_04970 [Candidatus Sulfotelmatobacter sp.]|jgi:hypothetical protein|nr:hypothetical protein [Candidatus Sulfotelmatobacter sp.]
MNYKGIIIEESLQDTILLKQIKVIETKREPITERHKTPWLTQWTLHTVEIPKNKAIEIAEKISKSFDSEHPNWYADYKNKSFHYIIYSGKIFKVNLANPVLYKEAKQYGISIGLPEYQVNFAPEAKV